MWKVRDEWGTLVDLELLKTTLFKRNNSWRKFETRKLSAHFPFIKKSPFFVINDWEPFRSVDPVNKLLNEA